MIIRQNAMVRPTTERPMDAAGLNCMTEAINTAATVAHRTRLPSKMLVVEKVIITRTLIFVAKET